MLMAPATHAVGSSPPSSSITPPPPWHQVVLVPSRQARHHHHQVLHDPEIPDLATPSPFPSPTTPASPPRHNNHHLRVRPASSRQRAAGKQQRRPRPSRKQQPITYISADAASFRRMVHQVTGFDHDVPLLHQFPGPEVLFRQAPAPLSGGALAMTETLLLPTLDTSAFLMLGAPDGGGDSGRGGAAPARLPGVSSCCHGSSSVVGAVDTGAVAALQVKAEAASGGGGFPSLEPWDEDDALFLESVR